LAVDSNVKPNLVELTCKSGHGTIAAIADQNGGKNTGKTNCENDELVFLGNAIKEG